MPPNTEQTKWETWEDRFDKKFDSEVYWQEMMNEMRIGDPDWHSMRSFIRTELANVRTQALREALEAVRLQESCEICFNSGWALARCRDCLCYKTARAKVEASFRSLLNE